MLPVRLFLLVIAAGVLAGCGGKNSGPGPTPVVDAPTVACPGDVAVNGVTGTVQSVTYPAPTVTAGTTPVALTCSPSSGTGFPLGSTTVKCTAIDAVSRQASCSFNVTLKGFKIALTKVLTFGDSVTEGQNGQRIGLTELIDVPNSYPTKLQTQFDAFYPGQGITVVNRGVGGEFIEKAVGRLPEVMAAERPNAVLIIDGYNNLLADCPSEPGVTPRCSTTIDFVAGKLRECVRTARTGPNAAQYVFVGTLTPPGPYVPTPGFENRRIAPSAITQLNSRIRSQIPGEGAAVVDLHPLFVGHEPEYTGPDGLHLMPPGNQVIADTFFAAIKAAVPQTPALSRTR